MSDVGSRREYDEIGYADEFVYSQECNVSGTRRRRTRHEYSSGDEFDPNEIFKSFFGHDDDVFRRSTYVYRTRTAGAELRVVELGPVARKLVLLLQLVMFLFIVLLVYRPYFGA